MMQSAPTDWNRPFVDQHCLQSETHQQGRLEDELAKVQQTWMINGPAWKSSGYIRQNKFIRVVWSCGLVLRLSSWCASQAGYRQNKGDMSSEAGGGQGGVGNGRVSSSHIKKSMETGESSFNIFYLTQLYLKYHFNIQSVYIVLIKYITISSPQHLSSD